MCVWIILHLAFYNVSSLCKHSPHHLLIFLVVPLQSYGFCKWAKGVYIQYGERGGATKKNWEIDRMIMWPMCSFDLESFVPILLAHIFAFIILKIKAV